MSAAVALRRDVAASPTDLVADFDTLDIEMKRARGSDDAPPDMPGSDRERKRVMRPQDQPPVFPAPAPGFNPNIPMPAVAPRAGDFNPGEARGFTEDDAERIRQQQQEDANRVAAEQYQREQYLKDSEEQDAAMKTEAGGSNDPLPLPRAQAPPEAVDLTAEDEIEYLEPAETVPDMGGGLVTSSRAEPLTQMTAIAQSERRQGMWGFGPAYEPVNLMEDADLYTALSQAWGLEDRVELPEGYNPFGSSEVDMKNGLRGYDILSASNFIRNVDKGFENEYEGYIIDPLYGPRQPARLYADGVEVDNPFSWWQLDYELRKTLDDGSVRRRFIYKRKTRDEWEADTMIRAARMQSLYAARVDRMAEASRREIDRLVKRSVYEEIIKAAATANPFQAIVQQLGGKQQDRPTWYYPWKYGDPMPYAYVHEQAFAEFRKDPETGETTEKRWTDDDPAFWQLMERGQLPTMIHTDRAFLIQQEEKTLRDLQSPDEAVRKAAEEEFKDVEHRQEQQLYEFQPDWIKEWKKWTNSETERSKRSLTESRLAIYKMNFKDQMREIRMGIDSVPDELGERATPEIRRLLAKYVYPWEDKDVETGMPIDLQPRRPKSASEDSMLTASHERASANYRLQSRAIQTLHLYMTQSGSPGKGGPVEYYWCGSYWRARAVIEILAVALEKAERASSAGTSQRGLTAVGLDGELEPGMPKVFCPFEDGESRPEMKALMDDFQKVADQLNSNWSLHDSPTPVATYQIVPTLTFNHIRNSMENDCKRPWLTKRYPKLFDWLNDVRGVLFNTMLFSTGSGRRYPDWRINGTPPPGWPLPPGVGVPEMLEHPKEAEAYEAALKILTGKLDVPDDEGFEQHLGWKVLTTQWTCLDMECLRLQYEEFDAGPLAAGADELPTRSDGTVQPAVPWTKYDHYIGQIIDQMSVDPFTMPLWGRWLAPRFYKKEGNPLLMNVWAEIDGYRQQFPDEWAKWDKAIASLTPEEQAELDSEVGDLASTIANNLVNAYLAKPDTVTTTFGDTLYFGELYDEWQQFMYMKPNATREDYERLWADEAAQYVTEEPVNPATATTATDVTTPPPEEGEQYYAIDRKHYRQAATDIALYLLRDRETYMELGSFHQVHGTQYQAWKDSITTRVGSTTNHVYPLTLDDLIDRKRQGYYTGYEDDVLAKFRKDLEDLFLCASLRYDIDFTLDDATERDNIDFFDEQYRSGLLQRLHINAKKFLDFSKICRRYYLDGYGTTSSTKELGKRKAQAERQYQEAKAKLDRLEAEMRKVQLTGQRQGGARAAKSAAVGPGASLQTQIDAQKQVVSLASSAVSLQKSSIATFRGPDAMKEGYGSVLSRLQTVQKLACLYFKPTPTVPLMPESEDDYEEFPGMPAPYEPDLPYGPLYSYEYVHNNFWQDITEEQYIREWHKERRRPTLAFEWRRRQAVYWLKQMLNAWPDAGDENMRFIQGTVLLINGEFPVAAGSDPLATFNAETAELSIDDSIMNKIGLHQIARIFREAQRAMGIPDGDVVVPQALKMYYEGDEADTYFEITERIKREGVPQVQVKTRGGTLYTMPRDIQAGMIFDERNAMGMKTSELPLDEQGPWKAKDLSETIQKKEKADPNGFYLDLLTGDMKVDQPWFYKRFDAEPAYFFGGESGKFWQLILERNREMEVRGWRETLQESAYNMTTAWSDAGIFGWHAKFERIYRFQTEPADPLRPVWARGRPLPIKYEAERPGSPGGPISDDGSEELPQLDEAMAERRQDALDASAAASAGDLDRLTLEAEAVAEAAPAPPPPGTKPWDRPEPFLFKQPYPMWHPLSAYHGANGLVEASTTVQSLRATLAPLGASGQPVLTPDDEPETLYDLWARMHGWLTGPSAKRSVAYYQMYADRTTSYRIRKSAYTNPAYYTHLETDVDADMGPE